MEQVSNTIMCTYDELNDLKARLFKEGHAAGKREAAEHILEIWNNPWIVTRTSFISRLEAYVEELK